MDKILVSIFGIFGIIFTAWYFLFKKEKGVVVTDDVTIIAEGGYTPAKVLVPVGKSVKLNFLRKDPSVCLKEIVFPDFKIKKELPLNKIVTVEITPDQKGEYIFACGMNMYHGVVKVV